MGRKWANIVAKKTARDGATSAKNAKFGVELYVAAKRGGSVDPEANSQLKFTIEKAKQAQVPRHVIENALKKAAGKSDESYTDGRYEGFGPNGSMVVCETLTPNVNRTIADIRTIFHKNGGNIGGEGSVSYMFDNTGVIAFKGDDADSIFELLLEGDIDVRDVTAEEGYITVYTEPADLHKALEVLKANDITEFEETDLELIPQSEVTLSDEDLEVFQGLLDALEDNEDVQKVYHNVENI
ncbi:YebC/PmpR family DNA-binding transcriptional regulator [Lactococcus nasutitermitis]|uniref:Probable transcriptional regulatory protein ACFO26_09150 n=1 Tax=Lactococcus nasutitermitis TaxID=1652957 RepID=A0ABV9JIB2_9LACT|nr:YebC/PmpR family DNA-binding transcriptional regulator [Lactococcus nasutitermitis]